MLLLGPLGRADLDAGRHDAAARRALAAIPDGAPVSATNALGAHLSERRGIFSFCSARRSGSPSTRRGSRTSTASGRALPARARGAASAIRLGARLRRGRRPRLPEALERNRLRQQVGAEAEREQLRAAVVLGCRERNRPDRVPRRQPGSGREKEAAGEPEPTRPRAASRASQASPATSAAPASTSVTSCGTSCSSRCGSAKLDCSAALRASGRRSAASRSRTATSQADDRPRGNGEAGVADGAAARPRSHRPQGEEHERNPT